MDEDFTDMRDELNRRMGNDDYDRFYTLSELPEIEIRNFKILYDYLSSGLSPEEFCIDKDFKPKFIENVIRMYSYRLGSIRKLYQLFRNGQLKQCSGYEPENLGVID